MNAFTMKRGILDLAVYIVGDGFGMLVKYPMPQTKIDAPIRVFSLYVGSAYCYAILPI